jgi:hypothetical protein
MTAVPTGPDTALTLLFGPGEKTLDTVTREILAAGTGGNLDRALKGLPQAARDAAAREVTTATAGLLNINLVDDVLLPGWRQYRDLTSAARRTLTAPGTTELVHVASHRVSAEQQPYIAILVNGRKVATLHLRLSLVLDINALLARVRGGRLVAILTGSCDVTATLAINGTDVASKPAHLDLPGEVALRRAVRLLPARDYPPSPDDDATLYPLLPGQRSQPVWDSAENLK